MEIYLTPASIPFLAQFLFASILCYYLWQVFTRQTQKNHRRSALFFLLAVLCFTLLILAFFLDASLPHWQHLLPVFLENPLIGAGLVLLFLFIFAYPIEEPRTNRIKWIGLSLVGAYAAYETGFGVYRSLHWLQFHEAIWRPAFADVWLVLTLFIVLLAFFLRGLSLERSNRSVSLREYVVSPKDPYARASRSIALVFLIPVALGALNFGYGQGGTFISQQVFYFLLSLGIVTTIELIAVSFVDTLPTGLRFRERLITISLAVMMAGLSVMGWAWAPTQSQGYQPPLDRNTSFVFTPVDSSTAFAVERVPFRFDSDLGESLSLWDLDVYDHDPVAVIDIDFPFIFFGKTYDRIYVSDNGAVAFDQAPSLRQFLTAYQHAIAIAPLYLDLAVSQPHGGVFVKNTPTRVTITWNRVPGKQDPDSIYTFQLALLRDGSFEINYSDLPEDLTYLPNNNPEATPLLSGVLCGVPASCGYPRQVDPQHAMAWPARINAGGFAIHYYLGYRQMLDSGLLPIALIVLGIGVVTFLLISAVLVWVVDKPMQSLADGLARVKEGRLDQRLPIYHQDEIGKVTMVFNQMVEQLQESVTTQEALLAQNGISGRKPNGLTDTQWQILQAVTKGMVYKEVAGAMHMSERTVKYHMGRIIEIMGVQTRAEAIALAQPYIKNNQN